LKRTFPHSNAPKPVCEMDSIPLNDTKPTNGEGQRRVRTSAAAIGLAISVGAASIALPKPSNASVVSESDRKAREMPDIPEDAAQAHPGIEAEPAQADSLASALMVPSIDKTVVIEDTAAPATSDRAAQQTAKPSASAAAIQSEYINHTVREGQTLWQIASAYRVDLQDIATANAIPSDSDLRVGETVRIPVREGMNRNPQLDDVVVDASEFAASRKALDKATDVRDFSSRPARESRDLVAPKPASPAELPAEASAEDLRVAYVSPLLDGRSHSTLDLLNQSRSGADQLAALPQPELALPMQIAPNAESGDRAALPAAGSAATVAPAHRVIPGDTLFAIASRHGVSLEALIETNNLTNPNALTPGQELVLPLALTSPASEPNSDETVVALLPENSADSIALPMTPFVAEPADRVAALSRRDRAVVSSREAQVNIADTAPVGEPTRATVAGVSDAPNVEMDSADLSIAYANSLRSDIARVRSRDIDTIAAVMPDRSATVDRSTSSLSPIGSDAPSGREVAADEIASARINPELSARESVREAASAAALDRPSTDEAEIVAAAPLVSPGSPAPAEVAEVGSPDDEELLAVAPLGARSYAPVLPPRSVSPDVPALAAASEYLPEAGTPMGDFEGYVWPAQGVLTSGYGWRWGRMHNGIDIGAPTGTPIVASAPGVVTYARWNSGGYGNLVEVTHPDGSLTLYAHNSRLVVSEGDIVEQGQHIADMGSTGFSTGPHLHFELHAAGQGAVNPVAYLQ